MPILSEKHFTEDGFQTGLVGELKGRGVRIDAKMDGESLLILQDGHHVEMTVKQAEILADTILFALPRARARLETGCEAEPPDADACTCGHHKSDHEGYGFRSCHQCFCMTFTEHDAEV